MNGKCTGLSGLKLYETEGPLGIPMKDAQAKLLETILKTLPEEDRQIQRLVTAKATSELLDGERAAERQSAERQRGWGKAKGKAKRTFSIRNRECPLSLSPLSLSQFKKTPDPLYIHFEPQIMVAAS